MLFRGLIDENIEAEAELQVECAQLEENYSSIHANKQKISDSFNLITTKINHLKARTYEIPEKPVVSQLDEEGVE